MHTYYLELLHAEAVFKSSGGPCRMTCCWSLDVYDGLLLARYSQLVNVSMVDVNCKRHAVTRHVALPNDHLHMNI